MKRRKPASSDIQYLAQGVEKTVTGPAGALTILRGVDLTVRAGESLAVVGASGSGKSTLLHILGALDSPSAGSVLFEGRNLAGLSPAEAAAFRNRELGFVFQFHHLLPEFTTVENVAMQAIIGGMAKGRALHLAESALERVGLAERRDHSVTTLSGGERQRAAIARATLVNLLLELNRNLGMTLVVVTHNRELAARMGRSLELRSGELYEQNPV